MMRNPMQPDLLPIIQTVRDNPDSPDPDALVTALVDERAAIMVACLAPAGTFAQTAAALSAGMSWLATGWARHTEEVVGLMTDSRWTSADRTLARMISTWSDIPAAVGVLADRFEELAPWANSAIPMWTCSELAILFGPSEKAVTFLPDFFWGYAAGAGDTVRIWSMAASAEDLTAWQAQISPDVLKELREKADPSYAFPAWGADDDDDVSAFAVLYCLVDDIANGWSIDHSSIRRRIAWLERHVDPNRTDLDTGQLAFIASIASSDAIAAVVCERISREPAAHRIIAKYVPWSRLHPRIREQINGDGWDAQDINVWLIRVWDLDVSQADLQARTFADLLLRQMDDGDVAVFTDLLSVLPPARRARFEEIIAWQLGRSDATAQPAQHRVQ